MSPNDIPMTLIEHLGELRRRLVIATAALLVGTVICFGFGYEVIKAILTAPLDALDPNTTNLLARYNPLSKMLAPLVANGELPSEVSLHAMTVMEVFSVKFKMAALGGFVLGAPVVLYQMWAFIGAGLLDRERRVVMRYLPLSLGLFVMGIVFGYVVVIPSTLIYLLTVDTEVRLVLMYGSYFSLIVMMLAILGLAFQLPLVTMALGRMGIVSPRTMIRSWRMAVVAIFIGAAIITPSGDPFTLCLLAVPLVGLYMSGIWLATIGNRESDSR